MLDSSSRFLQPPKGRFLARVIDGDRHSLYSLLACVFEGYPSSFGLVTARCRTVGLATVVSSLSIGSVPQLCI